MNILKPIDIENEVRLALKDYLTTYVRPLPKSYALPNVLVTVTGGRSSDTIDTFTVSLDARAETDADALDTLSTALGVLEAQAQRQIGALRHVTVNSLASWGVDPVRPDLKLCTATVIVTVHRQAQTITQN